MIEREGTRKRMAHATVEAATKLGSPLLRLEGQDIEAVFEFRAGFRILPFSVGSRGDWVIRGADLRPIHGFLYFDGEALFAATADPAVPVWVDGAELGPDWTRLSPPSVLELGRCKLRLSFALGPDLRRLPLSRSPEPASRPTVVGGTRGLARPGAEPADGDTVATPNLAWLSAPAHHPAPAPAPASRDAAAHLGPTTRGIPTLAVDALDEDALAEIVGRRRRELATTPGDARPDVPASAPSAAKATAGAGSVAATPRGPSGWRAWPRSRRLLVVCTFPTLLLVLIAGAMPAPPPAATRSAGPRAQRREPEPTASPPHATSAVVVGIEAGRAADLAQAAAWNGDETAPGTSALDARVPNEQAAAPAAPAAAAPGVRQPVPAKVAEVSAVDGHLERAAVDALSRGDYEEAARSYDRLGRIYPDRPEFEKAGRLARRKAVRQVHPPEEPWD